MKKINQESGHACRQAGFTLVELLISISIIAILAIILSVNFSNAQKSGRDQRRVSDLKAIQAAAEQYYLLSGNYPSSVNFYKSTSPAWTVNGQTILNKFPSDPKSGSDYLNNNVSSAGYCVCTTVEKSQNSNAEDASCSLTNSSGYYCFKKQQ